MFDFLKGCYFVMPGSIDTNVDLFWETFVGFLKSVVFVNTNVKLGENSTALKSIRAF